MGRLSVLQPKLRTIGERVTSIQDLWREFYKSPEWERFIAKLIVVRGRRCESCGRDKCRIFGDHIEELQDGGEPFNEKNIQLLCGSCHTQKTLDKRAERARTVY